MGRTKDVSLGERNRRICLYRRNGYTYSEIAELEHISRARVAQIVEESDAELPEEQGRAEIASLLEFAEAKAVDLVRDPGYTLTSAGHVAVYVDEDGAETPLQNKTIVNEALKTLILVADKRSKLFGWDKQVKRTMEVNVAIQQASASMDEVRQRRAAELEELRRAGVVQGEVLREIEPPQTPP